MGVRVLSAAPPYSFALSTLSSNNFDTSIKLNIVIISGGELRLFSREVVVRKDRRYK